MSTATSATVRGRDGRDGRSGPRGRRGHGGHGGHGGRRLAWVAVALLMQAGLVGAAVAPQLSARLTGDEYRLLTGPIDPVDPFRGAYVDLGYPGLPAPQSPDGSAVSAAPTGTVYVPLVRDDSVPGGGWKGASIVGERPASGPYLRCENQGWRLRCGIESWFVPQERALEIENAMRGKGAVALVRIDSAGRAAIVDLQPAT